MGQSSFWSLDPTSGGIRWSKSLNGQQSENTPVVSVSNVIYIADHVGNLYAFNPDGSAFGNWASPYSTGASSSQEPLAVGSSGTIYFKTSLGLYAINSDKSLRWIFYPGGDWVSSPSPVLDANENVYVAFGNVVYCLNPADGTILWQLPISNPGQLAVGPNNTILVSSSFANSQGQVHFRI